METIGSNIKFWRRTRGLSQTDLSELVGHGINVSLYESNKRIPTIKTLCKIAKVLCIAPADLLTGVEL